MGSIKVNEELIFDDIKYTGMSNSDYHSSHENSDILQRLLHGETRG